MKICDLSRAWQQYDSDKIGYSLYEIDIYQFQKPNKRYGIERPHRLSIRRNLNLGEFEAYKFYYDDRTEQVMVRGSLPVVLRYTNETYRKVFSDPNYDDSPCTHTGQGQSPDCGMVVR